MALQGDILAAHVLGIQNLVVVRGEDMLQGDHVDAKTVDDLDEVGLLKAINALAERDGHGGLRAERQSRVSRSVAP